MITYFRFFFVLILFSVSCGLTGSNFEVPDTRPDGDGWFYYIEAIPVHERNAKQYSKAGQESAEAAATQFFASLIQGNKAYEKVLPKIMSDRLVNDLNFYEKLDFQRMELVRKRELDRYTAITVRMKASMQGDHEEGEDELTLELKEGKWFVIKLPR